MQTLPTKQTQILISGKDLEGTAVKSACGPAVAQIDTILTKRLEGRVSHGSPRSAELLTKHCTLDPTPGQCRLELHVSG